MADLLLVTWDGGGNVPPLIGIGQELQRRGHAVRVLGHSQQADAVAASGLPFAGFRHAREFDSTANNSPLTYLRLFADRGMGRDLLAQPAPDLVVVDCLLVGVLAAAQDAGLPYVVVEHLFHEYFSKNWLHGPMGSGSRLLGLRPGRRLDGAEARLVASLPDLDPASSSTPPPNLSWTGPVINGSPAAPSQPTVLVSLSTINFPGMAAVLQRVLDAVGGLDGVRVVVTTGPAIDPDELHPSSNTELHRWVPHAELLPVVSLVIGHGGHSTTMAALAHDIPLLILPMHPLLDQPMVGKAVEAAGAGRRLSRKASPEAIKAAVEELLRDGDHRAAAARLGAAIRALPGASTAADRIEALLTNEVRPPAAPPGPPVDRH